jgi:hypothetical protein
MAFIKHLPDDSVSLEGVFALNGSAIVKADGTEAFSGDQSMGGFQLINLGTPVAGSAAANKDYVDNFVQGLSWKAACRAATTANIALSGFLVIDGVTLVANDRVLVKNQTLPKDNGIYAAAAGVWARTADANTAESLESAAVAIKEGLTNADTRWTQTNDNFTIGVDPITWVFIGAGAGVSAATFVVSPTPNVGDYTTIQSAVDALPAEGGFILVREGTYSITSPITLPLGKDIKIGGCGPENTIIDMGTNLISAFLIQDQQDYEFSDFTIWGRNLAGQIGFSHTAPTNIDPDRRVIMRNLHIGNSYPALARQLETALRKVSGSAPFNVDMIDCNVRVAATTPMLFDGSGGGGTLDMVRCRTTGGMSGGAVTGVRALNSILSSAIGFNVAYFSATNCVTSSAAITVTSACILVGSYFGLTAPFTFNAAGAAKSRIVGCHFFGVAATRLIDIVVGADQITISGSVFEGFVSQAVRIASQLCTVVGNVGCNVAEIGSADFNVYYGNRGFVNSAIIGVKSVIEGATRRSLTGGVTTGAFVQEVAMVNANGVGGIGTIKNTGGTSLEVRESVVDLFGVSSSAITTVLSGNDYTLDPDVNFGTARPPYTTYTIEVRHPGAATTYDLQFTRRGDTSVLS